MNPLLPKQILHGFKLPNSDLLMIGQLAKVLHASNQHVHNLASDGELEDVIISETSKRKTHRITRASLVNFIKRRTTGPAGDFQISEAPHGLDLPSGEILGVPAVSKFLKCSQQHTGDLIRAAAIRSTNIARSETGHTQYRIAQSSLIQFINSRTEGAC